jgi:hypothetical protein
MNSIHLKYNNDKHAYASQLNSFTHTRVLLVLHDRGILAHSIIVAPLGIVISLTIVNQIIIIIIINMLMPAYQ